MEQRVIKFRAWNDYPELEEPYMMSWKDLDKADNDGIFLLFDILSGKEKSIIPMQYTGLKDKNGKEIYEGDIISSCNGSINGTPWMNKDFVVEFKTGKFNVPTWSIDSTHWIEVIGNIYESKELLNKK